MADALPDRARVVVVGGGIVGCSVAYHLTQLGWTDVVLLERKRLTSGTTWHAAGLVTLARPTAGTRDLVKRSIRIFEGLEAATGQATGYRRTGTIHLATRSDRWEELQRQASAGRASELEIEVIDTERASELFPLLEHGRHRRRPLLPPRRSRQCHRHHDGPGQRAPGPAACAIFEQTSVTGVTTRGGRVTGVTTDAGHIEAEVVVNCTGMWGREFGQGHGVALPLQALAHYYVVTENIPGLRRQPADHQDAPTTSPTSRTRPVRSWSASSSRGATRGRPGASLLTRSSPRFPRTGTTSAPSTSG